MEISAAAIIAAAGSGTRMGEAVPKQFLEINQRPLLLFAIEPFTRCAFINTIIVVVPPAWVDKTTRWLATMSTGDRTVIVISGGSRRQDSVRGGLAQVSADHEVVIIHDGARPLVTPSLITRCYDAARRHGAAIAALPVTDTLKQADSGGTIRATIERAGLWRAQTPQAMQTALLRQAFARCSDDEVTDEAAMLEKAGIQTVVVTGESTNIKVTYPEDLAMVGAILAQSSPMHQRIGHGFDVHALVSGRKLILGGVEVAHHLGLAGHSDADVVCHALIDAILGAAGEGDIGTLFPDHDPAYKDADSRELLARVVDIAQEKRWRLANADITIVCQAPRLGMHIPEMRRLIAAACRVAPSSINVKATTTEHLGYTGRGEGIACHAVVMLESSAALLHEKANE